MSVKSALKIKINGQWVAVPVMIGDAEIDGVIRYDEAQRLTEEEKATARENIGAGTGGDVEIPNDNLVNGGYQGSLRGVYCNASSWFATAFGNSTVADATAAFATGQHTGAFKDNSFTMGNNTQAWGENQLVHGRYNKEDYGTYAHIVGNGEFGKSANAYTLDWSGNGWFAGSVYVGGAGQDDETASKLITQADMEAYVNEAILGGAW